MTQQHTKISAVERPHPGRVLVTGADGFIGTEVMTRLHQYEPTVTIATLDSGCDIRDTEAVQQAIADFRPDAVLHLAAVSGAMLFHDRPDLVVATNGVGTVNVFEAAVRSDVTRVHYASSVATFEAPPGSGPAPCSLYGATKLFGETLAALYRSRGLSISSLRIGAVYGGRRKTTDTLSAMVEQARRTGTIHYDPQGAEPLIEVRDVANLLSAAIMLPQPKAAYDVVGYIVPHRCLAQELAIRLNCTTEPDCKASASRWKRPFDTWSLLEDTGQHLTVGLKQGLDEYLGNIDLDAPGTAESR